MKIDLRTIPDAEVSGIDLMDVDITLPAPEAEPQRQYYFMALLKQQLVPERAKKNRESWKPSATTLWRPRMLTLSFTIPVPSVKTPIFASTAVSDSLANTKRKIRA